MMMYMARPAVQGRRRINLTAEASRSMDGWKARKGTQGLNKRAPEGIKKSSAAQIPVLYYTHAGQRRQIRTPPSWSNQVQGATTHNSLDASTRTHTYTISHPAGVQPTCNQRTTPVQRVQRHTRPFFCCSIDCRCKIHVNKRQWVVPRIFVSGTCTCTGLAHADR